MKNHNRVIEIIVIFVVTIVAILVFTIPSVVILSIGIIAVLFTCIEGFINETKKLDDEDSES